MIDIKAFLLLITTSDQALASWRKNLQRPPGKLYDLGEYRLHLYTIGEGKPTVILAYSLGGIKGYLLINCQYQSQFFFFSLLGGFG